MKRFNVWLLALVAFAIYLIVSAFVPVLATFDVFDHVYLLLAVFFVLLGLGGRSRSVFLVFLGLAFLSPYFHDLLFINYAQWTLFGGVVLLGVVADQVFKPRRRSKSPLNTSDESEQFHDGSQLVAKAFFSDNKYRSHSQNLEEATVDVQFGSLKLDLKQAQFSAENPTIKISSHFGDIKLRLPKNCRVDTSGLNTTMADVSVEEPYFDDGEAESTVRLVGNIVCASVEVVY